MDNLYPEHADPVFMIITALILWAIVIITGTYASWFPKVDSFFASRRHIRREKQRERLYRELHKSGFLTTNEARSAMFGLSKIPSHRATTR